MPTWFLDIKIPLVQKRYEMGDLSNPDYNIFPTPDSMGFQIVYEAELPFTSLDPENLKIEFPGGYIDRYTHQEILFLSFQDPRK